MMFSEDTPLYPAALTIAGSDSGGGAGIQADLRTFSAYGVFGCSAVTAVTCQNPHTITGIEPVSPENVSAQIRAVFSDFQIHAVKTGMLVSREIIQAAADELKSFKGPIVTDPVMIATSGRRLLSESAVSALTDGLFPLAAWITPNIPEAEYLTGLEIRSQEDMFKAAHILSGKYDAGIVLKGGHASGSESADCVVMPDGRTFVLESERLELPSFAGHGTGCTFSSAIAAGLALGFSPEESLRKAKTFVFNSLRGAVRPGNQIWAMFPERLRHV